MDITGRETRDFMNVNSFSQLPFIRPAPPHPLLKEKGAIRLFGIDFGGTHTSDSHGSNNNIGEPSKDAFAAADTTETSSRKFDCHYCCRNFPTSQALGGHQNAHKRERQQAKRAHLQSAMMHGGFADAHVYGRLGSAPATLPVAWNNSSSAYGPNSRLYGGYSSYNSTHQPQLINGSPLALWRIPAAHTSPAYARHSPMHQQVPLHSSKDESSIGSIPSPQFRARYKPKAEMRDHVSLDLHL